MGVRTDVPDLLSAMDVFVFPSIKEGLPLAVVESQASGLPTLISTGVPERAVVSNKGIRLSCEQGASIWADRIAEALGEAARISRCDCVEQVRAHGFDVVETARRLQSFYLHLADGDPSPRL